MSKSIDQQTKEEPRGKSWHSMEIDSKKYKWISQRRRTVDDDIVMIFLTPNLCKERINQRKIKGDYYLARSVTRLRQRGKIEINNQGIYKRTKTRYKFHYEGANKKPI
jgi:hypothetical protein